jgi:glucan phosphoethanolaminetransferase (alkaline phosphatase superfamily)
MKKLLLTALLCFCVTAFTQTFEYDAYAATHYDGHSLWEGFKATFFISIIWAVICFAQRKSLKEKAPLAFIALSGITAVVFLGGPILQALYNSYHGL